MELAVINGRSMQEVLRSDWDQAKRELIGEPDVDRNTDLLESAPQSQSGSPIHGSIGHKVVVAASEHEDDEGLSSKQNHVESGVMEVEHDLMLQASQVAAK